MHSTVERNSSIQVFTIFTWYKNDNNELFYAKNILHEYLHGIHSFEYLHGTNDINELFYNSRSGYVDACFEWLNVRNFPESFRRSPNRKIIIFSRAA